MKLIALTMIVTVAIVAVPQAGAALLLLGAGWLLHSRFGGSAPRSSLRSSTSRKRAGSLDAVLALVGLVALLISPTTSQFLLQDSSGAGAALLLLFGVFSLAMWPAVAGKAIAVLGLGVWSLDVAGQNPATGLGLVALLVLMLWVYLLVARARVR